MGRPESFAVVRANSFAVAVRRAERMSNDAISSTEEVKVPVSAIAWASARIEELELMLRHVEADKQHLEAVLKKQSAAVKQLSEWVWTN